jgi:putative acetyltransferase
MRSALEIADNWLRLTRIELTVYADNERAIRLYERTGFEVEGLLRRYATRQGELAHALMMARLR